MPGRIFPRVVDYKLKKKVGVVGVLPFCNFLLSIDLMHAE